MKNPKSAQELKECIYIRSQDHSDKQDMPVPREVYEKINPFVPPQQPKFTLGIKNPFDIHLA